MNEMAGGKAVGVLSKDVHGLDYPKPWKLRYSSAVRDELDIDSAWVIWIPDGSWAGAVVENEDDSSDFYLQPLSPDSGHLPLGWYLLPDEIAAEFDDDGDHKLYAISEGGVVRLSHEDLGDGCIVVAEIKTDGIKHEIKQIASSVVSVYSVKKPFDIEMVDDEDGDGEKKMKVVHCKIPCPINEVTAEDYEVTSEDNPIWLHIDFSADHYSATVNQTSRARSATHVQFKLYEMRDGKVSLDCRPSALPLFDIPS